MGDDTHLSLSLSVPLSLSPLCASPHRGIQVARLIIHHAASALCTLHTLHTLRTAVVRRTSSQEWHAERLASSLVGPVIPESEKIMDEFFSTLHSTQINKQTKRF